MDMRDPPNAVFHHNESCKNYLTKLEPRTHLWIQVTNETVEKWKPEKRHHMTMMLGKEILTRINRQGRKWSKFDVDDFDMLHDIAEKKGFGTFGGNLSVRKPPGEKLVMMLWQDKSSYSQYHLKSKQWVGPLGQWALFPKTDGFSLMISAIQSCETGFGVHISCILLEEINEVRRGTNYVNVDAAMAIHGQSGKKDLKSRRLLWVLN